MAHGGEDFVALRARWGRRSVVMCLTALAAIAAPRPLLASPQVSEAATAGEIAIVRPAHEPWPTALDAITFELDQAGYDTTIRPHGSSPPGVHMLVRRDDSGWVLVLLDPTRDLRLVAAGDRDDAPETVGLHAVELVYASRSAPMAAPEPDAPEPNNASVADTEPPESVEPKPHDETSLSLTARAPAIAVRPDPPRSWGFGVSFGASSLGTLGAELGARRRWQHAELGLTLAGGAFAGANEEIAPDVMTTIQGRGFFGVGLGAAYIFRPSHRLRPRLGVASDLIVPLVRSTVNGAGFVSGVAGSLDYDENGLNAGLFWTPAGHVGLELSMGPRLALRASVGGGPALALRDIRVAGKVAVNVPRWFIAGSTGLAF